MRAGHELGPYERICTECGTAFLAEQSRAMTCSKSCKRKRDYKVFLERTEAERIASHQKVCAHCGGQFTSKSTRAIYCSDICGGRAASMLRTLDRHRHQFRHQHGAEKDVLLPQMFEDQEGSCYLCGSALTLESIREVHIDHDHSCDGHSVRKTCEICRRGLACRRCNTLIGLAGDNPLLLRRIADNLEAANGGVCQRREGTLF